MSKKTRKHIWPVSLVMSIAIVGALAAFIVLATNPGSSSAHGGTPHDCSDLSSANQGLHDAFADPNDPKCSDTVNGGNGGNGGRRPDDGRRLQHGQHLRQRIHRGQGDHRQPGHGR